MTLATKNLQQELYNLHIRMFKIANIMEEFGDDETKEHAKELLGASKICKEWSENAKAKK